LNCTRTLYLDLLAATLTNQIYGDAPFDPWSAPTFDAKRRAVGADWPSQAMTMIGDKRMANIRHCVETVLRDNIPGDLIETGVWRGGACIYMRGILKAYGITDRIVWVADSFAGLPPPTDIRDAGDKHHTYKQLAVTSHTVLDNFEKFDLLDRQVRLIKGWFADTLPAAKIDRLAVLRLDGDMYASTTDALAALYQKVSPGGFVIVDDYNLPACRAAVRDYRAANSIEADIRDIDGAGMFWRVP